MEIDEKLRPYVKTFPATELMPYAEPILPQEMQDGRVYFALQFFDHDLLVPHLYPLIFLGHDLDGNSRNLRYFQDFDSYIVGVRYDKSYFQDFDSNTAGVRYDTQTDKGSACFQLYGPDSGRHIFEYENALKMLMRCALNRRDVVNIDERIRRSAEDGQSEQPQP